jgi:hypothetical protein
MKDKILFYYPQHFNRTAQGTNPFFDELLEVCDKAGIKYDLYEEPDFGTDKPHNSKAKSAKTFWYAVTIIRKIVSTLSRNKDFYKNERVVAKIFNLISFGSFKYKRYFTISGSMYHLFSHLNGDAPVYDVQHGVLGKHHQTFFDQKKFKLRSQFLRQNLHFTFWGEGYLNCFIASEENMLKGRVHVLGYPKMDNQVGATPRNGQIEKNIVVSLQFTLSVDNEELNAMKLALCSFLQQVEPTGINVLLKQHPRFNNCVNIDDILEQFANVSLTTEPLDVLAEKTFLHVTYYSTTAFEFAHYGVPSIFLTFGEERAEDSLFYSEYLYPLYLGKTVVDVINRLSDVDNYRRDSAIVKAWYTKFYTPFTPQLFLSLLE